MTHLIHIGFPRTGSTYLRYFFSQSNYFVHDMRAVSGFKQSVDFSRYSYSLHPEAKYFVLSEEELSCWSGPDFNLSSFNRSYDVVRYRENLTKTLKDFYGQPKILIVTRGHDAMVKSLYAQYVNYGGRMSFIEFIQSENGNTLIQLLDYSTTVEKYETVFGEDNVIVLPYELMQDNLPLFMRTLTSQLNVPLDNFSEKKINSSLDLDYLQKSVKLSGLVYTLLKIVGKKRELLFNYYAYLLMNRKFDWAFGIAHLLGKKINLSEEYLSVAYQDYLQKFPSQQKLVTTKAVFSSYTSLYK